MIDTSWWWWLFFMLLFIVPPLGYGWGYRGWGPPFPRFIQRRRKQRASGASSSFNHEAWGLGGDLVWMVLVAGVVFGFMALFSALK